MPLATREDLEAVIGIDDVEALLEIAVKSNTTAEQAEAARQARLGKALQAGANLIAQFITLPDPASASEVLREIAIEEAIYFLVKHTRSGASQAYIDAADQRRRDLRAMRKREQMPGSPEGQASHRPRVVASQGRYSTETKRRFY